jgi:alpha-tubulin suppressor-like RCC1 family protein
MNILTDSSRRSRLCIIIFGLVLGIAGPRLWAQTVATPTFLSSETNSPLSITVQISSTTPGCVIHYTMNGAVPALVDPPFGTSGTSISVTLTQSCTLSANAWLNGVASSVAQQNYEITGAISAGDEYTYGLKCDGELWAWGYNTYGNLGNATTTGTDNPVKVVTLSATNATLLASAAAYTGFFGAAISSSNNTVYTWGANGTGNLGTGNTTNRSSPGTVVVTGSGGPLEGALSVACGWESTFAVTRDHFIFGWGDNTYGELGDGNYTALLNPALTPSPTYVLSSTNPNTYLANITAVTAGKSSAMATDGTNIYTWGENVNGVIGTGSTSNTTTYDYAQTISFSGLTVSQIAEGAQTCYALLSDGKVRAWGQDILGSGTNAYYPTLLTTDGTTPLTNVVQIAAGEYYMLALTGSGTVWGCGSNGYWQLGDQSLGNGWYPFGVPVVYADGTQLGKGTRGPVLAIGAGNAHSLAIMQNGTVLGCGQNVYGELGTGGTSNVVENPTLSNFVANPLPPLPPSDLLLTTGSGAIILTWNGSPNATDYVVTRAESGGPSVVVYTGTSLTFADTSTISGVTYSYNVSGTNADGLSALSNTTAGISIATPTEVSAVGGNDEVILNWSPADGATGYDIFRSTMSGCGYSLSGTTNGTNFVDASASNGTTYYYVVGGSNAYGVGSDSVEVNATPEQSGTLTTPTLSPPGGTYPAVGNVTITCTTGTIHYTLDGNDPTTSDPVLTSGSSVSIETSVTLKARAWNSSGYASAVAAGVYNLTGLIDGGSYHGLAVETDGTFYAWGDQTYGRLGNGKTASGDVESPAQVLTSGTNNFFGNVVYASGGYDHSLAVDSLGNVWSFGDNSNGQLGNDTLTTEDYPVRVLTSTSTNSYLAGVTNVAAGYLFSLATGTNGSVWSWGYNDNGRTGLGTAGATNQEYAEKLLTTTGTLSNIVQVAAGEEFGIALDGTGGVWAWGDNADGEVGESGSTSQSRAIRILSGSGTTLNNVTDVAAGWDHGLAVVWDGTANFGTVWCWGEQEYGRLGNGETGAAAVKYPVEVTETNGAFLSCVAQVAAGPCHSLALDDSGNVWAWGYNSDGQLGDGTTTEEAYAEEIPIPVNPGTTIVYIGAGGNSTDGSSYALGSDGTIYSWGYNAYGELGIGTTTNEHSPVSAAPATAPTGITVYPGDGQAKITWNAVSGASSYKVYVSTSASGPFNQLVYSGTATTFTETGLTDGVEYFYSIIASNSGGNSPGSTIANGTPIPASTLWLRADLGVVTTSTSNQITTWQDESGNENSGTSSGLSTTLVANALNGNPVVQFSGGSWFSFPNFLSGASAGEVLVVVSVSSTTSNEGLWRFGSSDYYELYPRNDGHLEGDFGNSSTNDANNAEGIPVQNITQFHVYEASCQTGLWESWIDGVPLYSSTTDSLGFSSAPLLGNNGWDYSFTGDIAEMIVYNHVLTPAQRKTVINYLDQKYALVAAPATPANLQALALNPTEAIVTWTVPITNAETDYQVWRNNGTGIWTLVATVPNGGTYIDTGLSDNVTYSYEVAAVNGVGTSAFSSVATLNRDLTSVGGFPTSGMQLWLMADGAWESPVGSWHDYSGEGNDAFQNGNSGNGQTATYRPTVVPDSINGRPVVHFEADSTEYLNLPSIFSGGTSGEVLAVVRAGNLESSNQGGLWRMGTTYYYELYPRIVSGVMTGLQGDFGTATPGNNAEGLPTQDITQFHVYEASCQTGLWESWIDGVPLYSSTTDTVGFPSAPLLGENGNSSYFTGDIAEIIVYNRVLTADERSTLLQYLAAKYLLSDFSVDGDGLTTGEDLSLGLDPFNPYFNGDGLTNGDNLALGISGTNLYLNGDGYTNAQNIAMGINPFLPYTAPGTPPANPPLTITLISPANATLLP